MAPSTPPSSTTDDENVNDAAMASEPSSPGASSTLRSTADADDPIDARNGDESSPKSNKPSSSSDDMCSSKIPTRWTKEEDEILISRHEVLGNKWTEIAKDLPGRSDNAAKNRWHKLNGSRKHRRKNDDNEDDNNKKNEVTITQHQSRAWATLLLPRPPCHSDTSPRTTQITLQSSVGEKTRPSVTVPVPVLPVTVMEVFSPLEGIRPPTKPRSNWGYLPPECNPPTPRDDGDDDASSETSGSGGHCSDEPSEVGCSSIAPRHRSARSSDGWREEDLTGQKEQSASSPTPSTPVLTSPAVPPKAKRTFPCSALPMTADEEEEDEGQFKEPTVPPKASPAADAVVEENEAGNSLHCAEYVKEEEEEDLLLCPEEATSSSSKRRRSMGNWTEREDQILREAVEEHDGKNWKDIASNLPGRTYVQCLHRWQKVLKPGLVKGPWTVEEDRLVVDLVRKHGQKRWSLIAKHVKGRLRNQCRERWLNHLHPDINKCEWTEEEDEILIGAHSRIGTKWVEIAKLLPGRTENAVKNRWNSTLRQTLGQGKGAPRTSNKRKQSTEAGDCKVGFKKNRSNPPHSGVENIVSTLVGGSTSCSHVNSTKDEVCGTSCSGEIEAFNRPPTSDADLLLDLKKSLIA